MEDTGDGSVEEEDPREWSPQKVASFLRVLGTPECFQSAADQALQVGVDGSVFFELSLDQLEGVCGDGAAALEELRQQYEVIDKQNEVGKEESMSVAAGSSIGGSSIRIGGGNKRPSPESNSGVEGSSEVKNPKRERRVFTRVEKEILEERFNKAQLDDKKGREEVAALLSSSGKPLSEEQVRIWVDNFKPSLKKKKDGKDNQSSPNDKE